MLKFKDPFLWRILTLKENHLCNFKHHLAVQKPQVSQFKAILVNTLYSITANKNHSDCKCLKNTFSLLT